ARGQTRTLSGVTVLNRLTVRIRLTAPDATFLEKLAFPVAAIVSRHGAGTMGPFALIDQAKNGALILGPRHHYYGGQLQIDTVELVPVQSASAGLEMYRKGGLDMAWVPPDRTSSFAQHSDLRESNSLDAYYAVAAMPNADRLAASLDRDTLVKDEGPALIALASIVPPSIPDYVSSPPSLNVTAEQSGRSTSALDIRVAQPADKLAQDLRRGLVQQWRNTGGSGTVWIVHQIHMLPDPGRWLSMVSAMAPTWYSAALTQANGLTNDPVSRMNDYSTEEQWALRKGLVIPLAAGMTAYLIKPTVQSVDVTPAGLMPHNDNWSAVSITE
ncbi:MAG TPA: ABC transporter substrate-binding protein, partial [Chloroflexota bacterium]